MIRHRLAAAAAVLLLSACASAPVRPPAATDPGQVDAFEQAQQRREQALRPVTQWSLTGRVAVSNAGQGGSGRLEWVQEADRFEVSLSAPVTRQGWRLTGAPGHARLEGLEGGPREGRDARLLLLEATGWDIPFEALGAWLRGLRVQPGPPARIGYGTDGRPRHIEQGGWRIEYTWPEEGEAPAALPRRLEATRGEARVRLVVDQWDGAHE